MTIVNIFYFLKDWIVQIFELSLETSILWHPDFENVGFNNLVLVRSAWLAN